MRKSNAQLIREKQDLEMKLNIANREHLDFVSEITNILKVGVTGYGAKRPPAPLHEILVKANHLMSELNKLSGLNGENRSQLETTNSRLWYLMRVALKDETLAKEKELMASGSMPQGPFSTY